MFIVLIITLN